MNDTVTISQLQDEAPAVVKRAESSGPISITRHGKTVAFLISKEEVEGLIETMEVLNNPKAMQAIRDFEAGRGKSISLAQLEKKYADKKR